MVTDVLKEELGYKELIVTDAMNMGAIKNTYGDDQAVVATVESGEIKKDSIDESVRKIIVKKLGL